MIQYLRNKLVGVYREDRDTLRVDGVLDDDMYGIELHVSFDANHLKILSIDGKWNRWTTSECTRSIPPLQEAVGWSMAEAGFNQKVHKVIGRRACRHFANLLLECCHSAREAVMASNLPDVDVSQTVPVAEKEMERGARGEVLLKNRTDISRPDQSIAGDTGFIIDLHVHTSPASPCSSVTVDDLIKEAMQIGLDGICLTDHNYIWPVEEIETLRQRHGFLVLGATEITTDQGDILVFGLDRNIEGIIRIEDLREEVIRAGGYMIAAHPFRGFLLFGVGQLGLTPETAGRRSLFRSVDAIEVLNNKVTIKENAFAREVALCLDVPGTGGSDAHEVGEVGIYGTRFLSIIQNESELIEALRQGPYEPIAFREEMGDKRENLNGN